MGLAGLVSDWLAIMSASRRKKGQETGPGLRIYGADLVFGVVASCLLSIILSVALFDKPKLLQVDYTHVRIPALTPYRK